MDNHFSYYYQSVQPYEILAEVPGFAREVEKNNVIKIMISLSNIGSLS